MWQLSAVVAANNCLSWNESCEYGNNNCSGVQPADCNIAQINEFYTGAVEATANNSAGNEMTDSAIPLDTSAGTTIKVAAGTLLQYIQLYYIPVLVILGCLGNMLSVIVFFGTKLKKLSSSYYLAALAISDCGFLLAELITWLNMVNVPLFNKDGFCQMAIYCSHVCSFMSVWLVVLFTIERFIAVRYPLHRAAVCTVARAKLFIGCLTTLSLASYGPYLLISAPQNITMEVENSTKIIEVCALVQEYVELGSLLNHIDFSLTLVLPFCTIVVLNTLICRTVTKLASVRRSMTLTNRKRQFLQRSVHLQKSQQHRRSIGIGDVKQATIKSRKRSNTMASSATQTNVTQMLLVVSTVFICLNLPSYLLRVWVYVNKKAEMADNDDSALILLQHYANVLFATNFGINFILYCVSGQNFRRALYSLFRKRTKRERKMRTHNQTQTTILSELSRGGIVSSIHRRMTTTTTSAAINGTSSNNIELNEFSTHYSNI